jgi:hypothetical protein
MMKHGYWLHHVMGYKCNGTGANQIVLVYKNEYCAKAEWELTKRGNYHGYPDEYCDN